VRIGCSASWSAGRGAEIVARWWHFFTVVSALAAAVPFHCERLLMKDFSSAALDSPLSAPYTAIETECQQAFPPMTNPLETSANCAGSCQGCASVGSCSERIVCKCLKVTEDQVIHAITIHGARSLVELRTLTEAGDGCTCCHRELQSYLTIYSSSSSPAICSAR